MRILVLNSDVDISSDDGVLAAMRPRARAPLVLIYHTIAKGIRTVLVTAVLAQLDFVTKLSWAPPRTFVY